MSAVCCLPMILSEGRHGVLSRANPDRANYTLGIITCYYTLCYPHQTVTHFRVASTSWLQELIIMDDKKNIRSLVSDLSDLEVALLLSLAVHEHCLIETTDDCIHDVAKELALVILYTDCSLLAQYATNSLHRYARTSSTAGVKFSNARRLPPSRTFILKSWCRMYPRRMRPTHARVRVLNLYGDSHNFEYTTRTNDYSCQPITIPRTQEIVRGRLVSAMFLGTGKSSMSLLPRTSIMSTRVYKFMLWR